jgi:DNA mismatch repair protein MutL
MPIQVLADEVINQIAAGEVVERPASVVKELIENALDAGATQLEIYIEDGGKELIRVIDNGSGIDADELELAVTRHATSKITALTDLEKIATLGFRGEALASIASVSTVTVKTRTPESDFGYQITVESGKKSSITKIGSPVGTQVKVHELFNAVPARKKFLKSAATESKYISQLVTSVALAHPQVGIKLFKSGKETFAVHPVNTLSERVQTIWGTDFFSQLVPVFFEHPYVQLEGYVGKPQIASRTAEGWLFVNQRWIEDRALYAAVRDAYSGLLPPKSRPFFIIVLKTPAHLVDVNVHPRKEEVKFASPAFIFNSVRSAVQKALFREDLTPLVSRNIVKDTPFQADSRGRLLSSAASTIRQSSRSYKTNDNSTREQVFDRSSVAPLPWELDVKGMTSTLDNQGLPYFNFQDVYIFVSSRNEVIVYDQHALHERVLYERFKEIYNRGIEQSQRQVLLLPQEVPLSPKEREVWEGSKHDLEKLGFGFKEVTDQRVVIETVPAFLKQSSVQHFLPEVLEDWAEVEHISAHEDQRLSYLACRSAVKAGDSLSRVEVENLLRDVQNLPDTYTCPHGRPFKVKLSRGELDKWFKRTGFD